MPKNYLLFIITFFFFNLLFSQEVSQRDIKRSGLYYHYQSYDEVESTAKETAKRGLMSLVAQEVLDMDMSNMSEVYVNHIKYFVLPMQGETKVIAYVLKTDITNNEPQKKELQIVEIKDKSVEKQSEYPKRVNRNVSLDSSKEQLEIEHKSDVEKVVVPNNKSVNVDNGDVQITSTEIDIKKSIELSVLEHLVACTTNQELYNKLRKYNLEGKLRFVWNTKEYRKKVSSDNFNIVLISNETKEIVAFFKRNSLTNLKNNNHIGKSEFNQYKQVWIEMF